MRRSMNPTLIFTWILSMLALLASVLIAPGAADAQVADSSALFRTLKEKDSLVFTMMKGKLFSPDIYAKMITPQVKTKENKSMGLGWEIYDLGKGEYALGHGGSEDGVHTQVLLLPQSGKGLVIFTNVDEGYKVYFKLIQAYLGDAGKTIIDIELK